MIKIFFYTIILLSLVTECQAAFPVKYPATAPVVTAAATNAGNNIVKNHHAPSSLMARVKEWALAPWEPGEGERSMFWAYFGIFIWPLGILAIIHGIRGLGSRSGREQDRATLGLIFGIGETLLTIVAIIWIAFFLFYY